VAGWVLTHKLPWGLSMLAARPVCHKCWYGHNYPMAFHVYIECRHMLFEPPIRRRRRDWNTPRLRFVHSAPTVMQSEKYSEAGDRLA
jgi:hypothetical protein